MRDEFGIIRDNAGLPTRLKGKDFNKPRYCRGLICFLFGCALTMEHGVAQCDRCGWWDRYGNLWDRDDG